MNSSITTIETFILIYLFNLSFFFFKCIVCLQCGSGAKAQKPIKYLLFLWNFTDSINFTVLFLFWFVRLQKQNTFWDLEIASPVFNKNDQKIVIMNFFYLGTTIQSRSFQSKIRMIFVSFSIAKTSKPSYIFSNVHLIVWDVWFYVSATKNIRALPYRK